MAVVSVAGASFTVTIDATAYSDQVTTGTVNLAATVTRTVTLGDVDLTQTDSNGTVSLSFLYDDNSGMYNALETAYAGGTAAAVVVVGNTGTWTGSAMQIESLDMTVDAAAVATCSVSFTGAVTFA